MRKPAGVVESKTIRCLPGILSIQSSCTWRAGVKLPEEAWALASDAPDASAVRATVTPAPSRVRNERRATIEESLDISTSRQHGITHAKLRDDVPCTHVRDNSGSSGSLHGVP